MQNKTFDEMSVGDSFTYSRTISKKDIQDFAAVSGDNNPVHLSEEFAKNTQFGGVIAHGMLSVSFISTILGTEFPGPGTIFMGMDKLRFLAPVRPDDTVETTLTVISKHPHKPIMTLKCEAYTQDGTKILGAEVTILAPTKKISLGPQL